jgi:hypothetical protein
MAREAMTRLRFSNAEIERVAKLVQMHLRPVFYQPGEWGDAAVRKLARDAGDLIWTLMALARADMAGSAYPHTEKLDDLEARLRGVLEEQPSRLVLPVSGEDIMRARGLRPGPEVGRLKERLEALVIEGSLPPERAAILEYLSAHPDL